MKSYFLEIFKQTDEIFHSFDYTFDEKVRRTQNAFHSYFKFIKSVRITLDQKSYETEKFSETRDKAMKTVIISNVVLGNIEIFYNHNNDDIFDKDEFEFFFGLFVDKIANFVFINKLEKTLRDIEQEKRNLEINHRTKYAIVLDLLRNTDRNLYTIITRKMLNFLLIKGIPESNLYFEKLGTRLDEMTDVTSEINRPSKKQVLEQIFYLSNDIFKLAEKYLNEDFIVNQIHRWINDENAKQVTKTLNDPNTSLFDIGEAIRRFYKMNPVDSKDSSAQSIGMVVSLVRRFFSEQLEFIDIAKNIFTIKDFYELLPSIIFASESYGTIGGKGSGILLASKIIEKEKENHPILKTIKIPRTWFIPSDGETNFIYYNNLEDVIEQKYRSLDEIRKEYPYTMQVFKNSQFPDEVINGLSRVLDEIGDNPIVIRSSSLLEDRMGTAFAGKYKSLFVANQGTKQEKLDAILDAVAEVYASVFSPDPISYRKEKGFLDFNEGMGIIIQEVVGVRAGDYYFPAFAGVGFSNNEFRWSPRIKREDGLLRLVPGLGTRAVDRIGNDFPILIAPGQMNLRINQNLKDAITYSPRYIDVINLKTNTFETISIKDLIKNAGNQFPLLNEVFSIIEDHNVKSPIGLGIDTKKDEIIVTFNNLITRTPYIKQLKELLEVLKKNFGLPVDIEFASDGKNLYLLQCRQQSAFDSEFTASVIPDNIPKERTIFKAQKHISNGKIPDIAYIVYVDPDNYTNAKSIQELEETARAVGKLNAILPKRSFILMGPGRWGTRDDIRLGVKISYSDINNTAMLVEVAKSKGSYTPELSFGTHFFQDLVESQIYYLPLYPDKEETMFNYEFFNNANNTLERFAPEYSHISYILKVINVREESNGRILRILANSDEERALAFLSKIDGKIETVDLDISKPNVSEAQSWRLRMAEAFANSIDIAKYQIKGIYLAGSVFKSQAQPDSDIDIFVNIKQESNLRKEFIDWCNGWNSALVNVNFNRSGFKMEKILDVSVFDELELAENQFYQDIINPTKYKSKKLR